MKGVSTRKVDDLVRALGMEGVSRSGVSRICAELDAEVRAFRERPIEESHPYLWLDATFHKVRRDGRVVSLATVVAIGVSDQGERHILGLDVGPSEDEAFWSTFPALLGRKGPLGGASGDLRRPRRPSKSDRDRPGRDLLAEVPGALHAEPAGPGASVGPADGGLVRPHDLRPARPCLGDGAAAPVSTPAGNWLLCFIRGLVSDGRVAMGSSRRA